MSGDDFFATVTDVNTGEQSKISGGVQLKKKRVEENPPATPVLKNREMPLPFTYEELDQDTLESKLREFQSIVLRLFPNHQHFVNAFFLQIFPHLKKDVEERKKIRLCEYGLTTKTEIELCLNLGSSEQNTLVCR